MKKHVSIENEMSFMSFRWKCVNAIKSRWVGLMGVGWMKSFEVWKDLLWVEKTSENEWKVWVLTLIKVFSHEKLGWNGKKWKFEVKSSFLTKTQLSSHS